ncbi:deoxyribodipyrimidine photo-lyase [Actinomadura nitritigenes]|uniref:deoxyribodipyrimidine photo-lyase n=1 Tax=Actinomadura nitritigenes TaxID=134602 RepID=UPI003D9134E6
MFVFDDALLDGPFAVPNRVRFLLDALADLRESLRGLGGELVARRGDPVAEITCLARRTGAAEDHRRPAWGPHPVGRRPLPGVHPVLASLGGEPPASDRGGARGGPPAVRDPGRPLAGVHRPDAGHAVPRSCPRRRTGGTAAHGAMARRGRRRLRRGPPTTSPRTGRRGSARTSSSGASRRRAGAGGLHAEPRPPDHRVVPHQDPGDRPAGGSGHEPAGSDYPPPVAELG